ncbi:MAG: hypothetical protein IPM14_06300 [bacterium]|nr:hypothetical protein [bacterium]
MSSFLKYLNKEKSVLFLLFFLSTSFCCTVLAQPVHTQGHLYIIELDKEKENFVNELRLDVSPGDSIQFKSVNGDFAIYVINAISFLQIKDEDLKARVNSKNPVSEIYLVKTATDEIEYIYSIYCVTSNSWPDAPPRIIIVSQ